MKLLKDLYVFLFRCNGNYIEVSRLGFINVYVDGVLMESVIEQDEEDLSLIEMIEFLGVKYELSKVVWKN